MIQKPNSEAAETVQTTSVPAVDLPRLVLGSSDTPETDAATHLMQHAPNQWLAVVDAEFSEKLEREKSRLSALYHELLLSVESVHQGETRHETALRYIRERETFSCAPASDSSENAGVLAHADEKTL